jgi:hypothetical protein
MPPPAKDPRDSDRIDHARCSGAVARTWQQSTITSLAFLSNQRPSDRLTGHPVLEIRSLVLDLWRLRFRRQ